MLRTNASTSTLTNHFFKSHLSTQLDNERKLFVAYQKSLAIQGFINCHYQPDSYFLLSVIEITSSHYLDETMTNYLNNIKIRIEELCNKLENDKDKNELITFLGKIKINAMDANRLFETLLTKPDTLPERELENHLIELCRLDAYSTLEAIIKKQPNLSSKLPLLFATAAKSFHLNTMKKIIELGLDVNTKISMNKFIPQMRDYEDYNINWLAHVIISTEFNLSQTISILLNTRGCDISLPCVNKVKSILAYLLELGLDPDQKVSENDECKDNESTDNEIKNMTCRELCKDIIKEMKENECQFSQMEHEDKYKAIVKRVMDIWVDVLSVVADAPVKLSCKP